MPKQNNPGGSSPITPDDDYEYDPDDYASRLELARTIDDDYNRWSRRIGRLSFEKRGGYGGASNIRVVAQFGAMQKVFQSTEKFFRFATAEKHGSGVISRSADDRKKDKELWNQLNSAGNAPTILLVWARFATEGRKSVGITSWIELRRYIPI